MAENVEINFDGVFKERKLFCSVTINTCIHDIGLPIKLKEKLQEQNLNVEPEKIYLVNVYFDMGAYSDPTFYEFPVERRKWEAENFAKLDATEKMKQTIYDVLSAQLENICKELSSLNIKYRSAYIIGDDFEKSAYVELKIEEYPLDKPNEEKVFNSKKAKIPVAYSIIPDKTFTIKSAAKIFAELYERHVREENIKKSKNPGTSLI